MFKRKKLPLVEGYELPPRRKFKNGRVQRASGGGLIADILIILVLVIVMFICLVSVWKRRHKRMPEGQQMSAHEGLVWWWINADGNIGGAPNFGGYQVTFEYGNYAILKSYGVTIVYMLGNVLVGFVINVIGGYVLCRKTKLGTFFTIFLLITMLFNGGIIPTYMVIRNLDMLNNPLSLILPGCTNAMFVVLGLNAFKSVPESTIESAKLDGAGHFRIMFKIMLPQAVGLFIVSMINTAIISWNSWFEASIYITRDRDLWPLQQWIRQFNRDVGDLTQQVNPDYRYFLGSYCVIIISMVPVLLAMPFVQKQLQKGSLAGAVKE